MKMKPNDLLKYNEKDRRWEGNSQFGTYSHMNVWNVLQKYLNEDCVIAYEKNSLGVIFIIKTKRKYEAYISLKNLYFGGYLNHFDLGFILKLIDDDRLEIVNKEEFSKMKKRLLIDKLGANC